MSEKTESSHQRTDHFYEDLSRLNNELANLQREVARKNAELSTELAGRKQAENALRESEDRYRTLFNSMDEGFCIIEMIFDEHGQPVDYLFLEVNPTFEKQSGLQNAAGKRARELIPDLEAYWVEMFGRVVRTGESVHSLITEEKEVNRWLDIYACQVGGRESRKVAVVFNDITKRKQVEKDLGESREILNQHTETLETQAVDRKVELKNSFKNLESLNYTMAHDLRAPIRAMKSYTTALLEDVPLNEMGKMYADRIDKAAQRLDQLVNDLLDYGELSHLDFPVHTLELKTEIEKAIAENASEIQTADAEIQVHEPLPIVSGNETLLKRILSNFILNVLKFVAPGVKPQIRIWAEEVARVTPFSPREEQAVAARSGEHEGTRPTVRLWIEDNGIGIDLEYQEKIFGIFQRLHSTLEFPGTGVGLAIVKRAAERMGGSVGVESELGKGSRFWVELPRAT